MHGAHKKHDCSSNRNPPFLCFAISLFLIFPMHMIMHQFLRMQVKFFSSSSKLRKTNNKIKILSLTIMYYFSILQKFAAHLEKNACIYVSTCLIALFPTICSSMERSEQPCERHLTWIDSLLCFQKNTWAELFAKGVSCSNRHNYFTCLMVITGWH